MVRPTLEVADVFVAHADSYHRRHGSAPSSVTSRVLRTIIACRTSLLGGHVDRCNQCDHELISYNSCRDRHCPKCQASARADWLEARARDLLDVEYFHVVFTVPPPIAQIALQNKRALYGILLRASAETLKQIAADPKHLGAAIGFISVLHTWGQNLMHHPHVHCIVPGGGLSPNGTQWISCRPGFFLPVRVLSKVFRGKFLEMVRQACSKGELQFHGDELSGLDDPQAFEAHLRSTLVTDWVVYAKPPFGGPKQVLKYLANYTHRVAISNHRLVSMNEGQVRFRWRNYARGSRIRVMALDAAEFVRRFLLHTLPRGFVRIRHGGLLANSCRKDKLALCRELLGAAEPPPPGTEGDADKGPVLCPQCKRGYLTRVDIPASYPRTVGHHQRPAVLDSS